MATFIREVRYRGPYLKSWLSGQRAHLDFTVRTKNIFHAIRPPQHRLLTTTKNPSPTSKLTQLHENN